MDGGWHGHSEAMAVAKPSRHALHCVQRVPPRCAAPKGAWVQSTHPTVMAFRATRLPRAKRRVGAEHPPY
mgnify:CR=1 FL=1